MAGIPLRAIARSSALRVLSIGGRIDATKGWIRFPYYHHVHDDERSGFARQLDYLRNFGDFVSIDDAVSLLESGDVRRGRYFSIAFDDGFKSCATNALPILAEREIPATFYIVTDLVGQTLAPGDPVAGRVFGADKLSRLEFMSWNDCLMLQNAGMTLGSHSQTHARLATLDADQVARELRASKADIEGKSGQPCNHFCVPYGVPGCDFNAARDVQIASAAGYTSFATGTRGANRLSADLLALRRDHMVASWGNYQLRYFLSSD